MPTPTETLEGAIQRVRNLPGFATYKDRETHLYAVVYECDQPRKTKGTDFVMNLQLVDGSMQSPEGPQAVELIIFSRATDSMPKPQRGDIIELRHVVVQFWDPPSGGPSKPQLFGKLSAPHPFGYVVYRPTPPSAAAAAQPHHQYNVRQVDDQLKAEKLAALWPLASATAAPASTAPETTTHKYMRRIVDLDVPEDASTRPECVDIRVQVIAIDRRNEDEVVLFVWDATDARPLPTDLMMLPSMWRNIELKVQQPVRRMMPLTSQPPLLEVMEQLPPLGSAVPVIIERDNVPPMLPAVGAWVKLKVVGLLAVQGQMQIVFGSCSRVTDAQPAAQFDSYYKTRLNNDDTSEWPQDEAREVNIATWCSRQDLKPVTIRQVLLRAAQRHPGPFRVLLRLAGYNPRDLKQWCKKLPGQQAGDGPATESSGGGSQQQQENWAWAAQLLLEDATGELRALLLGHEATRLLGLPPKDLSADVDAEQLQHRLDSLSAVDQYGGVWMDVAITPVYKVQQQQEQQQEQQQQQGEAPEGSEAQSAGASSPAAAAAAAHEQPDQASRTPGSIRTGRDLFILHDAVCPHVHAQEEQDNSQQQHQPEGGADAVPDEGHQQKRQRLGHSRADASIPPAQREMQRGSAPVSRLEEERRQAMVFM